jgi:hypothetical protein
MERLGRDLCETVRHELGNELLLQLAEWKFEMLAQSALRQLAALDADAAQLLVIALSDRSVLPRGVGQWITSWASPHPIRPGVVVLLLSTAFEGPNSPMLDYSSLAQRANQTGMQLLLHRVPQSNLASQTATDWLAAREGGWISEVINSLSFAHGVEADR